MAKYPKLIGLLQSSLRKQLSDQEILIKELNPDTGVFTFVNGKGIKYIDDELGHKIGLLPLRINESVNYWFSINLIYNTSKGLLKALSISVFTDNSFKKLFRAEWSNNESASEHAQPHWHLHIHKVDFTQIGWSDEDIQVFSGDVEELVNDKVKNIHFAMAAFWHKKLGHVESLANSGDTEILSWLDGVLRYIHEQLIYIHDKTTV